MTVPLEDLLGASSAGWDPAARRAGGAVRLDWRAGHVAVRADRERLSQALGNLVSNAIEHGSGGVGLRARRVGRDVRVEVANGGRPVTIAASRQRDGRSAPPSNPRHGRGLAIASRAVEEAGGRLELIPGSAGDVIAAVDLPTDDACA